MTAMLCQEPWCYLPEQIARLTDWQLENLYAKPALERSKRLPSVPGQLPPRAHAEGASTGPPGEPGSPEHRNACIGAYMGIQGLSRERAVAQYEKQLAQWKAEQ